MIHSKSIAKKNCIKTYHIIYSLCSSAHVEFNKIRFVILWFFYDLLWFFKTPLGGNLIGFGKFRGWYRPFYRLRGYVVHPHRWGGDIDFFPKKNMACFLYIFPKRNTNKWEVTYMTFWNANTRIRFWWNANMGKVQITPLSLAKVWITPLTIWYVN